ncbi:hypothetical protein [Candidatus Methylacidiphilum infernorum]|uniref:Uncharacterized protein n=1 Tax=Methylacidiphilum infernorum (isolate V4) TaxID=481448 RepID=B3E0D7_METI4|nr:hypothetical protein [Candidatus Methylacidiphilum infernorum]ACD84366.1 Hypothetical protein Minf_2312 [Methylacidiphilum infernorum V4]
MESTTCRRHEALEIIKLDPLLDFALLGLKSFGTPLKFLHNARKEEFCFAV